MRVKVLVLCITMFLGDTLFAQNYYMQYTHDTLGNRTGRARGVLTREMASEEISSDTVLQLIVPPVDTIFAFKNEYGVDDSDSVKPGALIKTREEKEAYLREMMARTASLAPIKVPEGQSRSINDYDVGAIPLQYGVSPTGARTYSIPIATAPDIKYAPSLAFVYNSQGGYGYGGYGWDLAGLSVITIASKSLYYDGTIYGASVSNRGAVFMLDGVRLVQNEDPATSDDYPLVTATGHILAAPHRTTATRFVTHFDVLFPNGVRAIYGFPSLGANSQFISYPMIESVNLDGEKIQYEYSYDRTNDLCHLDRIKYGFDSMGNASGVIQWQETSDSVYQYYAGKKLWRKPRIDCLISQLNGQTLYYYDLYYNSGLLTEVHLTNSSNRQYPSIMFTYGPEEPHVGADSLQVKDSLELSNYWVTNHYEKLYKRGKFVNGRYNDGIFSIPDAPTYGYSSSRLYHSPYPVDQVFLFSAVLSGETSVDYSLTAGQGFQTAEVVDINGDGIDEIVTVNFRYASFLGTQYTIRVYGSDSDGVPVQKDSFVVWPSGSVNLGLDYCPSRRSYHWGDFDGDGKCELLMQEFATNGFSENQQRYTTIVDLESHSIICERNDFINIDVDDARTLFCLDINGDGVTEICRTTQMGTYAYKLTGDGSLTPSSYYSVLTKSVINSEDVYFADVNADGYIDVLKAAYWPYEDWQLFTNTGTGFVSGTIAIGPKLDDDTFFFIDINRDGYPDIVRVYEHYLGYSINHDGTWFGDYVFDFATDIDAKGILPGNVVDYSSMSSFVKVDGQYIKEYRFTTYTPEIRQLIQSKDSYGAIIRNTYRYLPQSSHYWTDNPSITEDGFQYRVLPIYVLSGAKGMLSQDSNSEVFMQDNYSWYDGVVSTRGLGFCGFSKTRKVKYLDTIPVNEVSSYNPMKAGIITSQNRYFSMASGSPYYIATYSWDNHSTTYGKLSPRLTQSVSTDNTTGVITTTSYSYDSFDFPVKVISSSKIGPSGTSLLSIEDRTYSHSNTTSKYVLGTIVSQRIVRDKNGSPTNMLGERSTFTYDACFRPLTRNDYKIIAQGNPMSPSVQSYLVSKSRWTYDSHGNVLTEESAPYSATEYTGSTYTYDASGHHLTSSTNALGQTTTYSNFDKYSNARTVTDYRNRVRTNSFDSWGKQTKTVYADGTVDSTATAWGGQGVYTATRMVTGKPSTIVHYDALSREIRTGNKRFNGQWQYTDTEYNERGLIKRISLPFRGTSASYWNTYKYDNYSRQTKITEASGRISQWSYSGTSVTEVKDGITVTKTSNAVGDLVSVSDAAGSITYTLRDDGQPSSVTAPGSVTTSFTYDNYGRRTSIVDSSAGTRSTSYLVNSDGSSVTTETNALGSIATSADKYGRVTGVTRTGTGAFNTTYTYDAYGRLSSEASTNSTGEEYTYDAYDRVSTVKETVPDGKWLQKTYAYGAGGNVSSIAYSTQDGAITTEYYSYANGHNNVRVLSGGTTALVLTGENDLGQPTSATSGSVSRTYEYTAYGFPTKRKLTAGGNILQDLRTSFNPETGNLSNRSNAANSSSSEYFYYDALGRLNYDSQGPSAYDIKGNVIYRSGTGTMTYPDATHPYRIERLNASSSSVTRPYAQTVAYTAYDRPASISEWMPSVAFTYNADYQRVKMQTTVQGSVVQRKYYIGDRYEREENGDGSLLRERLFVGGDAYSAPMVLQRTSSSGSWTPYVIGRDYLGSITNIVTTGGSSVAEYSYDAWGRMRDPQTLTPYSSMSQPSLLLGRGYCGHEHLPNYGLINMNARLYDPVLGRFMSPDPYVQAPDFSQNFNRYAYALNNPLKYTDESGESLGLILGAAYAGGFINWLLYSREFSWRGLGYFGVGAIAGVMSVGLAPLPGWLAVHTQAAGVWAGALVGALGGAAGGAASAALPSVGNNLLSGRNWDEGLGTAAAQGALFGAISGAISGGIQGYRYAIENGANPWNNRMNEITYKAKVKKGVSTQPDPSKHCYAYSAEYADAGHGNHKADEFIAANNYADGGDFAILGKVSENAHRVGDRYSYADVFNSIHNFGYNIENGTFEAAGVIGSHWNNIIGISSFDRISMFGGQINSYQLFRTWDPATGIVSYKDAILFTGITIFKF